MALANHRKTVAVEIARYGEQVRSMQVGAASRVLKDHGIDLDDYPPAAVMLLINAISRVIVMEEVLGMSAGHAEIEMVVERWLGTFEDQSQKKASIPGNGRKRPGQRHVRQASRP